MARVAADATAFPTATPHFVDERARALGRPARRCRLHRLGARSLRRNGAARHRRRLRQLHARGRRRRPARPTAATWRGCSEVKAEVRPRQPLPAEPRRPRRTPSAPRRTEPPRPLPAPPPRRAPASRADVRTVPHPRRSQPHARASGVSGGRRSGCSASPTSTSASPSASPAAAARCSPLWDRRDPRPPRRRDRAPSRPPVVCLGDSFDDGASRVALGPADETRLTALTAGRDWTWIAGNHDPGPLALPGRHLAELTFGLLDLPPRGAGVSAAPAKSPATTTPSSAWPCAAAPSRAPASSPTPPASSCPPSAPTPAASSPTTRRSRGSSRPTPAPSSPARPASPCRSPPLAPDRCMGCAWLCMLKWPKAAPVRPQPLRHRQPLLRQQATSVFDSRHAIVIGPTPPGTGVIAPASAEAANSTSPTIIGFPVRPGPGWSPRRSPSPPASPSHPSPTPAAPPPPPRYPRRAHDPRRAPASANAPP